MSGRRSGRVVSAAAFAVVLVGIGCSAAVPPPPATDTPYPADRFPYVGGSEVVFEGRDATGHLESPEIELVRDVFGERTVGCRAAHGTMATVVGNQYQSDERRWYLLVRSENTGCEGYVPEALVRGPWAYTDENRPVRPGS